MKCADGRIYTGCTKDFIQRMANHGSGKVSFTKSRLPASIIAKLDFLEKKKAFELESYLKPGSGKNIR